MSRFDDSATLRATMRARKKPKTIMFPELNALVSALSVQSGDVLVVTYDRQSIDQRTLAIMLEKTAEKLRETRSNVLVVGVPDGMSVELLDEEKMARFGWVRQAPDEGEDP
jgi:hypothetical protein